MSDLILPDFSGLTITTTDGQELTLQPGQSVMDLLPGGGGGEPLWRLAVTQGHRDDRLPGKPDTLFLARRTRSVDAQGNPIRHTDVIELGKSVRAWPLGMAANRSYFASKYDPNNPAEAPDCRSETFLAPDAAYMGKISTTCARLDPRTGKLVPACPMAQWGAKGADGKSRPPRCNEQYILFLAISVDRGMDGNDDGQHEGPELIVCEAYFKSASATAGKTAIQILRSIQAKGTPIWTHPIDIVIRAAGVGTTYVPLVRTDVQDSHAFNDDDRAGLAMAVQRAEEALRFRLERSQRVDDTPAESNNAPRPAMRDERAPTTIIEDPNTGEVGVMPPQHNSKRNGKKQVDPLI